MMVRETVARNGSSLQASRNGKNGDSLAIGRLVVGPDLTRSNSSTSRTDSETSASRQGLHSSRVHGDTSAISDDSNRRIAGVPWSDQTYPPYIDPGVGWNTNEEYSSRSVAPSRLTLRSVGSEQLPDFHKHGMEGIQSSELPVWGKTWHPPSELSHGHLPESVQQRSLHPHQPLGIPDTAVRASNHSSTAECHQVYSSLPDHQYQQEYSSWQPANGKYFSGGLPQQEMARGQSNVQHPPSPTAVPPWMISSQEENVANAGGIYNSNGHPLQYDYPNSHSRPAAGEREELRRSGSGGFQEVDRSSSGTGSGTLSPEVPGVDSNVTGNGHSSSSGGNLSRVNSFELLSVQSSKGPKEKPEGPVRWGAIALEHMDTFVSRSSVDRSENKLKFRSTPSGIQPKVMSTSPSEGQLTARPASSTQDSSRLPVRRQLSPSLSSSSKQTSVQPNDGGGPSNSSVVQEKNANKLTGVFMKLQQSEGVQQVQQSGHGSPHRPQNVLATPSRREGNSMSAPSGPIQSSIAPGASSVVQPPPSQNQPASRPGSEAAQSDGGIHLPRRTQSDMSLLKTSMQALAITVQGVAQSVQQVTTAHKSQTQTSNSISQELSELRAAVTKLSEGLNHGFMQLTALIRHKDTQQQARLLNLATMYDQDTLVPLPSDLGIIPSNFPATRKVFVDLTPEAVLDLLKHYNLQLDPADMRFEYLGRFVGLRWG